jgi:hypothetical protein
MFRLIRAIFRYTHFNLSNCTKETETEPNDSIFLGSLYSRFPPPHLRTETDPVSETLCFLVIEFRMMDKVLKPSINEQFICKLFILPFDVQNVHYILT